MLKDRSFWLEDDGWTEFALLLPVASLGTIAYLRGEQDEGSDNVLGFIVSNVGGVLA